MRFPKFDKIRNHAEQINGFFLFLLASLVTIYLIISNTFLKEIFYTIRLTAQLTFFISLLNMAAAVLIINTAYYAYASHRRTRMILIATAFTVLAAITALDQVFFNNALSNSLASGSQAYDVLFEAGYVVFISLLLASALTRLETRVERPAAITTYAPIVALVAVFISSAFAYPMFSDISNYTSVIFILRHVQFILFILTIMIQLRTFLVTDNMNMLIMAYGIALLAVVRVIDFISELGGDYIQFITSLVSLVGIFIISHAIFRYNISIPFRQLEKAKEQIKEYTYSLEDTVRKRTYELEKRSIDFNKEIEYAKSIQQSLLPSKNYKYKNATFMSEYYPCEKLSGDFFDIYMIDETHVGMYVLDVSGHGISAALMTMFCNNFVRSTERLINRYRGLKPHRNLQHFYEEFNKTNFPQEMHMVIMFASLDIEDGLLTYSNGGITNYPIISRRNGTVEYLDQNDGFPICKVSSFFTPDYYSTSVKLEKGDKVIFYTDGLVDDQKNQIMDEQKLEKIMEQGTRMELAELSNVIKDMVLRKSDILKDDVTYFIMEYN